MFIVYIISSLSNRIHYIGYTSNLEKRLRDHNTGLSRYTSHYRPWEVIYTEHYVSRSEAMRREKFLKSGAGYTYLKKAGIYKAETNPPEGEAFPQEKLLPNTML